MQITDKPNAITKVKFTYISNYLLKDKPNEFFKYIF